jgi:hypothetical protein
MTEKRLLRNISDSTNFEFEIDEFNQQIFSVIN